MMLTMMGVVLPFPAHLTHLTRPYLIWHFDQSKEKTVTLADSNFITFTLVKVNFPRPNWTQPTFSIHEDCITQSQRWLLSRSSWCIIASYPTVSKTCN